MCCLLILTYHWVAYSSLFWKLTWYQSFVRVDLGIFLRRLLKIKWWLLFPYPWWSKIVVRQCVAISLSINIMRSICIRLMLLILFQLVCRSSGWRITLSSVRRWSFHCSQGTNWIVDGSMTHNTYKKTHEHLWDRCNAIVKLWIVNNVSRDLLSRVIFR